MVRRKGEREIKPVWLTEKLYGARVKIEAFTTLNTTIQESVVP